MAILDNKGNIMGYIETKSGKEGKNAKQAWQDQYLERKHGIVITYVYDDLDNFLY